ncbi:MAG TPA: PAS domain-containing protein [Burkholderiaceae bacterium]|nr:PAS domain-containing protein [Burkholderiaceae bacterium]
MTHLTHEEERWRTAVQNAVFGIWDLNPRCEVVQYSPQWKSRLGFPRVDSPDSTSFWRSRVHPDDFNPMLRALRLHLDGYTPTYEMRFRLRAGNFRYLTVLSRGRVVERDHRGEAVRMVGTMVDLTRRWPTPVLDAAAAGQHLEGTSPLELLGTQLQRQVGDLLDIALLDGSA